MIGQANANIAEMLRAAALAHGDQPALLDHHGRILWTFGGLASAAARLAGGLVAAGLPPGGRVLALTTDPATFVLVSTSSLWAGATLVIPPHPRSRRDLVAAVAATKPDTIIASPAAAALAALHPALRQVHRRFTTGRWQLPGARSLDCPRASEPIQPRSRRDDDVAIVSHTTGTTGLPKAITRTHGVLRAQHAALAALRPAQAGDIDLVGLPLLALHNLASGIPSVLPPTAGRGGRAPELAATVQRTGVTTMAGFPSFFEALVSQARAGGLPQLRALQVGGARVQPALLHDLRRVAPAAEITIIYGATEAEPIAAIAATEYLESYDRALRGEGICLGRPAPGIAVRLSPLADAQPGAGPVVGRIHVAGPRVVMPRTTSGAARELDTGDIGWLDHEGRIWHMGRAINLTVPGLYPGHVEPIVEALPWARAAALVRVDIDGQPQPALAVEPEPGAWGGERRWRADLQALAARHGWPLGAIIVMAHLPRDARSGSKVDYTALARAVQRAAPGRGRAPVSAASASG